MKTRINKRALGIIALAIILVISLVLALYSAAFLSPATYSAENVSTLISGNGHAGVDVYVSGNGVTRNADGSYSIPKNTDIEITVVNNTTVSTSLTVTDGIKELQPIAGGSANFIKVNSGNADGYITINIEASVNTERGKSLAYPYEIFSADELMALSKILAANSSDVTGSSAEQFAEYLNYFGFADDFYNDNGDITVSDTGDVISRVKEAQTNLSKAYFRLTDDIMLNESNTTTATYDSGYFGLGSRRSGVPFSGVFDFNGYTVTMNMVIAEATAANFSDAVKINGDGSITSSDSEKILSIGFFNFIQGDGKNACAIIDGNVRGTISISAQFGESGYAANTDYRLYAGGMAGTIGDKVVLDNVTSSASLTVNAGTPNGSGIGIDVYAGGLFGFSSAGINFWSNVSYNGNYSEVSVSNYSNAVNNDTIVGSLAGVIQNAYVNGFTANLRGANIIADSTNSGSALAGGLAGVIYSAENVGNSEQLSSSESSSIQQINISAAESTISALSASKQSSGVVTPDAIISNTKTFGVAISGGVIGTVYATASDPISITNINLNKVEGASGALNVIASISSSEGCGATFAGGVFGYIMHGGSGRVTYTPNLSSEGNGKTIFNCDANITSTQSGIGPAYAGGIFGYNAFSFTTTDKTITFNLNASEGSSVNVTAEQTETAQVQDTGDYWYDADNQSHHLYRLYEVSAGFFSSKLQSDYSLNNFTFNVYNSVVTARRATGSLAVGDISAGAIAGKASFSENSSARIDTLTVNMQSSSVNALGHSFASNYGTKKQGNNVYAGGVLGYAVADSTVNSVLNNITIKFSGMPENGYAVRGIQNAVTGDGDYCSEGYSGGMFGMLEGCSASNLVVDGTSPAETLVYLNCTNSPNTACIGGLIGATRLRYTNNEGYTIQSSTVRNVHVAGRAYFGDGQTDPPYDLYVGGAVGVLGTDRTGTTVQASNIVVENSNIESVGEENMLTYAGGVFGGIWYQNSIQVSNCISRNSSVLSSSASYETYSGGICGLIQGNATYITSSYVIDTIVNAITYSDGYTAYAAGICPGIFQRAYISECVSNAVVSASGTNRQVFGIGIWSDGASSNNKNNYFIAANVKAGTSLSSAQAFNDSIGSNNYAIALVGSGKNNVSSDAKNEIIVTNDTDSTVRIYYKAGVEFDNVNDNVVTGPATDSNLNFKVQLVGELGATKKPTLNCDTDNEWEWDDFIFHRVTYWYINVDGKDVTGTYYAQFYVQTPNGQYELLCSYPIIFEPASGAGTVSVTTPDFTEEDGTNETVNGGNSHYYVNDENNFTYFQIYAGEPTTDNPETEAIEKYLQNVIVSTTNVYQPTVYLVTSNLIGYNGNINEIQNLINNKGNAKSLSEALEYFNIAESESGNSLSISPVLGRNTGAALILQYDSYYVVIEVIPNKIEDIYITPAEDTPARAIYEYNGNTYYVYAPGDTFRLDAILKQHFPYNLYIVDVTYGNGDNVPNTVNVRTNGTVQIGSDFEVVETSENGELPNTFTVKCTSLDKAVTGEIHIMVANAITVTPENIQGASYKPQDNNNAVTGHEYTFYLDPNPGYGLNPKVTLNIYTGATPATATYVLDFQEEHITNLNGSISPTGLGNNVNVEYTFDAQSGRYTITLPKELFAISGLTKVGVSAVFERVYSIMFDLGYGAYFNSPDGQTSSRYFIYKVKQNTDIDTPLLNSINETFCYQFGLTYSEGTNHIYSSADDSRKDFVFKGFYSTDSASSLRAYGTEFLSILDSGNEVHGALNYYARWNYIVELYAPENITIKSALISDLVETEVGAMGLIPIDIIHGFSFTISSNYVGIPRVEIFSKNGETLKSLDFTVVDGVYNITDPSEIDGIIVIKVYGDNISLARGETDADSDFASEINLREDGIFTVRYAINHTQALGGGAQFTFSQALPENTAIRLFYQVNETPISVGEYIVTAENSSQTTIVAESFTALQGSPEMFAYNGTVTSEVYYLVVTLPNNKTISEDTISVTIAEAKDTLHITNIITQPAFNKDDIGSVVDGSGSEAEVEAAGSISATVNLYGAVIRKIEVSESSGSYKVTYTVTDNGGSDAPADIRHEDKYYVLRIKGEVSSANGYEVFTVGEYSYVIIGGYDAGTADSINLTTTGSVSEVALMEVTNPQYPASGTILQIWPEQGG